MAIFADLEILISPIKLFSSIRLLFALHICGSCAYGQELTGERFQEFETLLDSANSYRGELEYEAGLKFFDQAEAMLDPELDKFWLGRVEAQRGNFYFAKGMLEEGGFHFKKSEHLLIPFQDSIAYVINKYNLGNYYMMTNRYNSALQKFFSCTKHVRRLLGTENFSQADRKTSEQLLAACLHSLGTISLFTHDEEKAVEYYLDALDQFSAFGDSVGVSHSYINIGEAYTRIGKADLAKAYMDKGHKITVALGREIDLGLNFQIYGKIDALNENWDAALKNYRKSKNYYEIYSKTQDLHILGLHVAEVYLQTGQIDSAQDVIKKSITFLDANSDESFRAEAYGLLAETQVAKGNYVGATQSYGIVENLKDSVIYHAERNMANEMISFIDDERNEYLDSLTMLRNDVDAQKHELELTEKTYYNRFLIFSLVFLGMALIAVLYFLRRNRKINKLLNQSLHENQVLFREVHHRVKNNFQIISSLLNLQIGQQDNDSSQKLNQLKSRIMSMSLVHELLYKTNEANSIEFNSYAFELLESVISGLTSEHQKIETAVKTDNISFSLDVAIPLGLIMNEAFTNSVKYAFPEGFDGASIFVELSRDGDYFLLQLADNGIGISNGPEKTAESLGHELIEILSQQLEGKFDYIVDKGTVIRVWFKADPV